MNAGDYRHRVTIKYIAAGQDSVYGTPTGTLTTLVSRAPANVQDVMPSRDERVTEGLSIGSRRSRVRMRWRDDIDSAMEVTIHEDSDRVMKIIGGPASIGAGRKREIELMCEAMSS